MPAWLLLLLSLGFMMRATVVSGWEVVALPVSSRSGRWCSTHTSKGIARKKGPEGVISGVSIGGYMV
jgi:hypothetical protein